MSFYFCPAAILSTRLSPPKTAHFGTCMPSTALYTDCHCPFCRPANAFLLLHGGVVVELWDSKFAILISWLRNRERGRMPGVILELGVCLDLETKDGAHHSHA